MMNIDGCLSRRRFLRFAMVGGVAVPVYASTVLGNDAGATVQLPADPGNLTDLEKLHIPKVTLPPVVEDGSQAPIVVEMDHPMEDDHYIKSVQILNFDDPIIIKGKFYLTPANGEVYLGTQIRLDGGEGTVWVIAECNQHGRWAASRNVKVAAGGC
jgi:predicted secreted protein